MFEEFIIAIFGENYIIQDIVIACVGILFGVILLPQLIDVIKKGKILNTTTAGLTSLGLFVLVITFISMEFWIAVIADIFTCSMWLLIFFFSVKNKRRS